MIDIDPVKRAHLEEVARILGPEQQDMLKKPFNLAVGQTAICRVTRDIGTDGSRVAAMVLSVGTYFGVEVVAPSVIEGIEVTTGEIVAGNVPDTFPAVGLPTAFDMTWQLVVREAS